MRQPPVDRREQRVLREIRNGWRQWPALVRCVHGRRLRETLRRLALDDMHAVEFLVKLGDEEGLRAVAAQFRNALDDVAANRFGFPLSEVPEKIAGPILREALSSGALHLHEAAAYWLRNFPGNATAAALIRVIEDRTQPLAVRENAIESLGECMRTDCRDAVFRCLTGQLANPHPVPRFWAVFALGGDRRAIPHLEKLVDDPADEGCMWSVGLEARAILSHLRRDREGRRLLQAEMKALIDDPNAPPKHRQWAAFYWEGDWTGVEWKEPTRTDRGSAFRDR